MVAWAGCYYGTAFQGARGVMQGYPLFPTIFNVVVDAVVRNWLTVAIAGAEDRGESENEGRHQAALFYVYYVMVASSDPHWLQGEFNTLVVLYTTLFRSQLSVYLQHFPRSPHSSELAITTVTQLRTTASTTTLTVVGESRSSCVTLQAT